MMSRRFSKVSSVILLVLFAFFFASTNLFFHTHEGLSGKIVHSHPWGAKSHNHTGAQFQTISMLSANIFEMSAPADILKRLKLNYPDKVVVASIMGADGRRLD